MSQKSLLAFPKSEIKVLLLEKISPAAEALFRDQGFQIEAVTSAMSEEELLAKIADVHVLGVRSKTRVTAKVLTAARRLLAVGCFCIGTDQTDLPAAAALGKPVFNAPFANTRSVAELVLANVVCLLRQVTDRSAECHRGVWNKVSTGCYEARGKTIGIIGYGHVGSQVSVLAEAFGMKVIFYDIIPKLALGNAVSAPSLGALLAEADVVTVHVPGTSTTRQLIGAAEIDVMKHGAYVINAARGDVVDVAALAAAVKAGKLAGCAVDVFPMEPANKNEELVSELRGLPNTILTPHVGGSTEEAQEAIGREVADKIISFINTGATMGAVNLPEVSLPPARGTHRILNFHENKPGVLRDINNVLSSYNVGRQMLVTQGPVGYLIVDVDAEVSDEVKRQVAELEASIKTRLLF